MRPKSWPVIWLRLDCRNYFRPMTVGLDSRRTWPGRSTGRPPSETGTGLASTLVSLMKLATCCLWPTSPQSPGNHWLNRIDAQPVLFSKAGEHARPLLYTCVSFLCRSFVCRSCQSPRWSSQPQPQLKWMAPIWMAARTWRRPRYWLLSGWRHFDTRFITPSDCNIDFFFGDLIVSIWARNRLLKRRLKEQVTDWIECCWRPIDWKNVPVSKGNDFSFIFLSGPIPC